MSAGKSRQEQYACWDAFRLLPLPPKPTFPEDVRADTPWAHQAPGLAEPLFPTQPLSDGLRRLHQMLRLWSWPWAPPGGQCVGCSLMALLPGARSCLVWSLPASWPQWSPWAGRSPSQLCTPTLGTGWASGDCRRKDAGREVTPSARWGYKQGLHSTPAILICLKQASGPSRPGPHPRLPLHPLLLMASGTPSSWE